MSYNLTTISDEDEKNKGVNVAYVHFLPDTLDGSIQLPSSALAVFKKYITHFYNTADYLIVVNPIFIKDLVRFGIDEHKLNIFLILYLKKLSINRKKNIFNKRDLNIILMKMLLLY